MSHFPIIKLEIESLKHSILHELSQYHFEVDSMVKEEIKKYCREDNIRQVLRAQISQSISHAIKQETENFFSYGPGREFVKAEVIKKLSEGIEYERY